MDNPFSVAASRFASPGGDLGLRPRYAEHAAELEEALNRTIAGVALVQNSVVVGFTLKGGGNGTLFEGMVHFGNIAGADTSPTATSRVFLEECAVSDQALAEAATRLWNRIALFALSSPDSLIHEVQIAAGGSGPKFLIGALVELVPATPPPPP